MHVEHTSTHFVTATEVHKANREVDQLNTIHTELERVMSDITDEPAWHSVDGLARPHYKVTIQTKLELIE